MGLDVGLQVEVGLWGPLNVAAACVSLSAALARLLLRARSRLKQMDH